MKRIRILLLALHSSLFTLHCEAQNQKVIDSLQIEMKKYEAYKKELGTKAMPLMDTAKANIMYKIFKEIWYYNPDTGIVLANQIVAFSDNIGYKKGVASGYNGMGLAYMTKQDFTQALDYFQKALQIRIDINDKEGVGWTYNNIGIMYGNKSDYKESIKYHLKAIKVREEIGDKSGMAASYGKMGHLYSGLGNFPEGLKDYFIALKLGEELKDKDQIAISNGDIGQIYYNQGNFNEALKYYQYVLKIGEETGNKFILSASYAYMGNIYLKQGNFEEAIKNQQASLKINKELGDDGGSAFTHFNLAMIYITMKNYDEALKTLYIALEEHERLFSKHGITLIQIELGGVYEKQGAYQEALKHELLGLQLAAEIGAKDEIKKSYNHLSDIYAAMYNYKTAYDYQLRYQQLKDSLFNDENASKMKGLQMQYDFDREDAIQKSDQDKKDLLLAKEVEKQKFRRNVIFLVMAIVVIFLIIVIILRNRIAKERRQKSLEQERSRISRDLHDDLGAGLISIYVMSEQIQNANNNELTGANVEKIKQSSKQMIEQMRIIIWTMNSSNDTLENLIIYVETFAKEYFEHLPIKLNINLPERIAEKVMTGMMRRNIFLVVKETLANINKHTHATEVSISVTGNDQNMMIVITDNGIGFNTKETRRFGNGLKNMNNRMNNLKGTFEVESIPDKGTKTSINFPLV